MMTSAEEEPIIYKYTAEQAMADGLLIEGDPPCHSIVADRGDADSPAATRVETIHKVDSP